MPVYTGVRAAFHRELSALLALAACAGALAAGLDAVYLKTLGQANPDGVPLKGTGLRQVLPDGEGNLYLAVVRGSPWTSLAKVTPAGSVLWETDFAGYAPKIPLALSDGRLYAVSLGANYNWFRRVDPVTGKIDPAWGWGENAPPPAGFRPLQCAAAMVAAGPYLYIADTLGHEIRRFDRATAAEKPFAARLMVVEPIGLALAGEDRLLVLTPRSVLEVDLDGKPLRVPLIDRLPGAQALQADAATGTVYVALGGEPGKLVNEIRQYDAEGRPTGVRLGRGGDFNGKWTPDAFAFSAGQADFALDARGGLWVNTGLGQLVHYTAVPALENDRILMSTDASSIAVDGNLDVYLGVTQGEMKLSWENRVLWTCGIRPTGDGKRYPGSPIFGWPVYLAGIVGSDPAVHLLHDGHAFALSAGTGELAGAVVGPGQDNTFANRIAVVGGAIYMGFGESRKWEVTRGTWETLADWKKWDVAFTPPAGIKAGLLGMSPDGKRVYLSDGRQAYALDLAGKFLWQQPTCGYPGVFVQPFAMLGDAVVFLADGNGRLVARDAATGELLAMIGDRPAINGVSGLAVAAKEGKTFLFVATGWGVRVYQIAVGR